MKLSRIIVPAALMVTACGSKHSSSYEVASAEDQGEQVQELRGPRGECSPFLVRERDQYLSEVEGLVEQINHLGERNHLPPNQMDVYTTAHSTRMWLKKYGRTNCREVSFRCELNMAVEQCPRNKIRPVVRKFNVTRLRTGLKRLQDYLDTY
jgi:hypothetical protein